MRSAKLALASVAVLALTGLGFTGTVQAATPADAPAHAGTCPDKGNKKRIPGAYARWDVVCNKGNVFVVAHVKDTRTDGKCAHLLARNGRNVGHVKVCGKGKTKHVTLGLGKGKSARVHLFTR